MILGVIPARYGSTRFPGKPLAPILGKPMIEWVWRRASSSQMLQYLIVATDSEEIVKVVEDFGGEAMLTDLRHGSGTSRSCEVANKLCFLPDDTTMIIQGDEPTISPQLIDEMVRRTIVTKSPSSAYRTGKLLDEELYDSNVVKVLLTSSGKSLYFSRDISCESARRHIGLYCYPLHILRSMSEWKKSQLERYEDLEQLRLLENDIQFEMVRWNGRMVSVDTPGDIEKVENLLS